MKNTTITPISPDDSPESFVSLIADGVNRLNAAAAMLKRLVDSDREAIAKIRAIDPTIPPALFARLLQVAQGSLCPELILNCTPAAIRLRGLPYAVQSAALKACAVDLVLDAETGESVRVPLNDLNAKQVSQVFDQTGFRGKDEQRALLKRAARPLPKATAEDFPWIVKRDRVIVHRPCEFTKKDLLRMMDELS